MDIKTILNSTLHQYHTAHDLKKVPVKVDFLKPMVEERGCVDKILIQSVEFASSFVLANVKFHEGSLGIYSGEGKWAEVTIASNQNFCWTRFISLKEMYHCMLDSDDKDRVRTIEDLEKLSESLITEGIGELAGFSPYQTERAAEFLALETLFPYELRNIHAEKYVNGSITSNQLAVRYRIPETYVGKAMGQNYMNSVFNFRGAENLCKI